MVKWLLARARGEMLDTLRAKGVYSKVQLREVLQGRGWRLVCIPAGNRQYRFTRAAIDEFLAAMRAARNLPDAIEVGPRPETPAEAARRVEGDVAAMNAALGIC